MCASNEHVASPFSRVSAIRAAPVDKDRTRGEHHDVIVSALCSFRGIDDCTFAGGSATDWIGSGSALIKVTGGDAGFDACANIDKRDQSDFGGPGCG